MAGMIITGRVIGEDHHLIIKSIGFGVRRARGLSSPDLTDLFFLEVEANTTSLQVGSSGVLIEGICQR